MQLQAESIGLQIEEKLCRESSAPRLNLPFAPLLSSAPTLAFAVTTTPTLALTLALTLSPTLACTQKAELLQGRMQRGRATETAADRVPVAPKEKAAEKKAKPRSHRAVLVWGLNSLPLASWG